ncbi:Putative mediator complex, subunit Med18 [Septoria linicola]|uniref:Mediator of RNA polymerase II transcription subunit 18 n=1 Tax=Septoria linicola TaxID=215465 RepID=A0A9Q9EQ82_9PEZI|nr:putative mediator complex, subunit Med18 [Septoria linicola]USW58499.1 Putative mediator complex, subunit Med18 [Septoria linicola]
MREYLLYTQIPAAREEQVLSILAGLSGNQPTPINEHVVLYAQQKAQEAAVSKKQSQNKPSAVAQPLLNYRLSRDFDVEDEAPSNVQPWTFRAESVPDSGLSGYIARSVTEHPATSDELARMKQPQLYQFKRQYVQTGNRFVRDNVIVKILRYYSHHGQMPQDPIDAAPVVASKLKLVDGSGTWLIEVTIRVEDGADTDLNDKAIKELMSFQSSVTGALDLIAPDRLALDTRVKHVAV